MSDTSGNNDPSDSPETVQATFLMPEGEINGLVGAASERGNTVTHSLRQAIAVYALVDETVSEGGRLLVEQEGQVREIRMGFAEPDAHRIPNMLQNAARHAIGSWFGRPPASH